MPRDIDHRPMDEGAQGRTVLEVNLEAEPISGFVRLSNGRCAPFSGYLGLLALLHRLQQRQHVSGTQTSDHLPETE